uniref:Protein-serine/threonine kinase n=1 Tax=Hemiselmis tepida TaxID=464990 RepID=A0A7S0VT74_9CRYP|mmetsp:Transcript_23817/g.60246  ORF Transcript_23817/g.60246 Transcript_23817/m.60246 type:complete len:230 (+) Transcript_23817:189-878(+)
MTATLKWLALGGALCAAASHPGAVPAQHKAPGMLISTTRPAYRPRLAFAPVPALWKAPQGRATSGARSCSRQDRVPDDIEQTLEESLRMDLRLQEAREEEMGLNNSPSQLVTYGDVFRQAMADVEAERAEEEGRRIRPVAALSMVGNSFRQMLERLVADPPQDEISRNLEAFAMQHPGVVGLPVQKERVQTKADLDRLEAVLDMELDDILPTQPPAYLDSLERSSSRDR